MMKLKIEEDGHQWLWEVIREMADEDDVVVAMSRSDGFPNRTSALDDFFEFWCGNTDFNEPYQEWMSLHTLPLVAPAFAIPEEDREYLYSRPGLAMWTKKRDDA